MSFATIIIASCTQSFINDWLVEYNTRRNLPFSIGDEVKIRDKDGYLQGTVSETGRVSIIWLPVKRYCFGHPYYRLSSTVIFRSIVKTILLKIDDVDKISQISKDIIEMMRLNANVSLEMGLPYCNCSQESSYAKLTLGCDVKDKETEKYILQNAVRIIKGHGGELDARQDGHSEWTTRVGLRRIISVRLLRV